MEYGLLKNWRGMGMELREEWIIMGATFLGKIPMEFIRKLTMWNAH